MVCPSQPLPYGPKFHSANDYISALLDFITDSKLHQALCGGVHILDFLTLEPDLYSSLIPEEWRSWFAGTHVDDILDLLLRESVDKIIAGQEEWRGHVLPPKTLLDFIVQVRDLLFNRSFVELNDRPSLKIDRRISVGMNMKKEHEVSHFASFVAGLTDDLSSESTSAGKHEITHLVDFGSGQNYLGRVLAGPKYQKHIVGLESRLLNIEEARKMDVHAKLAKKPVIWRNKKMWFAEGRDTAEDERLAATEYTRSEMTVDGQPIDNNLGNKSAGKHLYHNEVSDEVERRIEYIEHAIVDGNLRDVSDHLQNTSQDHQSPELLVISLHSCGNLVHHGLRSLVLNDTVKAVVLIGCCYNLCTERLGPPTYKLPTLLRSVNQRLTKSSLTCDPHGFPMSEHFLKYRHAKETGIRFNITARMMAVQASSNWTKDACGDFFTRHFYRALIQRIFLDTGFINTPIAADEVIGGTSRGWVGGAEPIIIGRLSKSCYKSFVAYVHGAVHKIGTINPDMGPILKKCLEGLTEEAIAEYELRYIHKRHELCVVWSLMSFAAQLVECAIVSDRWQFLIEQEEVGQAWVQTVFDYGKSPRNLAIVGIKKSTILSFLDNTKFEIVQ